MSSDAPDTARRSTEEATLSSSNKITIGSAISVFLVMIPVLVFVIRMDVRQEAQTEQLKQARDEYREQMKEVRAEQRAQGERFEGATERTTKRLDEMNERLLRIELRDAGTTDKGK